MAVQTLRMRIQLRRATTAKWTANKDVVPAAGEPCFDVELNTLKIGDGAKTYEQLEPIGGAGTVEVSADGTSIVLDDGVFKLAGFDAAETGAQPRKKADGTLEWVVPSTETVEGLQTTVAGLQSDVTNLQTDVSAVKEILTPSGEGSSTLLERVEGLEGKVGDGSVDDKITAAINKFATDVSDDGVVNSYKELIDYVAKHGDKAANMAADITALQGLVGNKSVSDQINEAVSGKVDAAPGKGLSTNDFTDTLLEKLENIESGAQVNKIEKIDIGGSTADIVNKTINIPIASIDKAGVIRSSTGANKVNVSSNGEMSVNKISVDSIFVPIGSELILDGGGASTNPPVYPTRIGNIGYDSIVDAINGADNGDVVTLQEDVNMGTNDDDHLVINAENVTIDLGAKTFTANGSLGAVKIESGVTTLNGTGTVSGTLGSDNYSMAIWCTGKNAKVIINDGTYCNSTDGSERGTDLIYASSGGNIEINGGTFIAAKPEWTLNCRDADYKAGISSIIVRGGRFYKFNPADCNCEGEHTNFVADGYKSVEDGDYYTVVPV